MQNNTFNRIHNSKNPYQTNIKKVLCLCSAGLLRGPTAANVLHRTYGYNTRSAGVTDAFALILADDVLYNWADEIVTVEDSVARHIPEAFLDKVTVLNVPDMFTYMAPELQEIILKQYKEVDDAHLS